LEPEDVAVWRKEERKRLLALRSAIALEERRRDDERITAMLLEGFTVLRGRAVGFYWPMKGEFDPRVAVLRLREEGAKAALPVVVRKAAPLEFRAWWPGVETVPGVYDLPVPRSEAVIPEALLMPPVGFDALGYRLGYGGGYFDRTNAALGLRPLRIGVGRELCRIPTIHPQPYDIAMDFVVTEAGVYHASAEGLRRVDAAESNAIAARLLESRGA
jgi:5,10-methenyltetrahydrofolate synthetase